MTTLPSHPKITARHQQRRAIVYIRQSTERQLRQNKESQRLQYELADQARAFGFQEVELIDADLGRSAAVGAAPREGFERLIASVAIGEVGMILSREVSRLSRTDKDWCQLLELCQLFDTLIADADQVYDVRTMDDQLVLGIKGTLSVVELKVLNQRLQQGMEAKAKRGDLVRLLPPGYIRDGDGHIVKDPDQRVCEAIDSVFRRFRRTRGIRQTFLWFKKRGLELPVNKRRGEKMTLVWQVPTHAFINGVLHNPCYAGAYVWGQRRNELALIDGKLTKRTGKLLRAEDCRVFIPDHHESYIDWQTYQDNLHIMQGNATKTHPDEATGAVRAGKALLAGLLRCGRCGRKIYVRYWGKSGTSPRYGCNGTFADGGDYCLNFGGASVDRRFSQELLTVLTPLGVEASLEAAERLSEQDQTQRRALSHKRDQLDFEAKRAFEQYNEVDPRHRLVAAELERRWNTKLEDLEAVIAALAALDQKAQTLTEVERTALRRLGEQFIDVWDSPHCPVTLQKTMIRTLVKEVIVSVDAGGEKLAFIIHWHGGSHTGFDMPKPRWGHANETASEAIELIREMAVRYNDAEMARVLNKNGSRTGRGNRWTQERVASARRKHVITGRPHRLPDPKVLTLRQAARHCGVSPTTIKRLVKSGLLKYGQVARWAPWEIKRAHLDSAPIRQVLAQLKATGKLPLPEKIPCTQQTLFQ